MAEVFEEHVLGQLRSVQGRTWSRCRGRDAGAHAEWDGERFNLENRQGCMEGAQHGEVLKPACSAGIGIWFQCQKMKGYTSGEDQ